MCVIYGYHLLQRGSHVLQNVLNRPEWFRSADCTAPGERMKDTVFPQSSLREKVNLFPPFVLFSGETNPQKRLSTDWVGI